MTANFLMLAESAAIFDRLTLSVVAFVLALFLGREVITKVPATLHTPLMSGSNAISGITIVGALLIACQVEGALGAVFGFLALVFATINVVGGFVVTNRFLAKFRRN